MASSTSEPPTVYRLEFDANRYARLLPVDFDADAERLEAFDGTPIGDGWVPPRLRWETENGSREPSDFLDVGVDALVFSDRAADVLGDLLESRGEWLPIEVVDGPSGYRLFNVTRVSDALDEGSSELARFESSGRLKRITSYAFDPEAVADEAIFKLRIQPRVYVYVTEPVRQRVEDAGLTGFLWDRPVWGGALADARRA